MAKFGRSLALPALLLVVIAVIPPWNYTFRAPGMATAVRAGGYAPLWAPPATEQRSPAYGVQVDLRRLGVEALALIGLAAALMFLGDLRTTREEQAALDRQIDKLFVDLWTIATHQEGYVKAHWNEMRGLLIRKGVRLGQ